ncbi:MAG: hypothetical protein K0S33_3948 [Bacteroidetes bacterium]|jgi:hypothetical protein|nr:hypothetical protein [Bacteroidota bacterium]
MKTTLLALLIAFSTSAFGQYINIPDPVFRALLIQEFPSCFNASQQMDTTCMSVMGVDSLNASNMGITNVEGLQYIAVIDHLDLSHNAISSLPANAGVEVVISYLTMDLSYNQLSVLPDWITNTYVYTSDLSHNNFVNLDNFMINVGPSRTNCSYNQLSSLPPNPRLWYSGAWTYFYCAHNNLTSIPAAYFADSTNATHLDIFDCSYNAITSLPTFYGQRLYCNNNPLTDLPDFSDLYSATLETVNCSYTSVSNLNKLQDIEYLNVLNCSHTTITSVPVPTLSDLNCSYCTISSLHSQVTYRLNCKVNPINCLPPLHNDLQSLLTDSTNITCVPNMPPYLTTTLPVCGSSAGACQPFPLTTGHVFIDHNGNGINDNNDYTVAQQIIKSTVNNWYSSSDSSGLYAMQTDTGITTNLIMPYPPSPYYTPSPAAGYNVLFHAYGEIDSLNDFSIYPAPNKNDLETYMFAGWLRPGFDGHVYVNVKNAGTTMQNITLKVKWDNTLQLLTSLPAYQSISGDTMIYTFNNVMPLTNVSVAFQCHVDSTVPLGTPVNVCAIAEAGPDETPLNNNACNPLTIVGSFDPNAIEVNLAQLAVADISAARLFYTVHFQNTGTFLAQNIKVVVKADPGLLPETIQVTGSSHYSEFQLLQNGYIVFNFPNIMLPDSTSNESMSHGLVAFSIKPSTSLQLGNQIKETASIYFDYNLPVLTNEAITVITNVTALDEVSGKGAKPYSVYPNPFTHSIFIKGQGQQQVVKIEIMNLAGEKTLEAKADTSKDAFNLSGLENGIYFVRIIMASGTYVEKIIKR